MKNKVEENSVIQNFFVRSTIVAEILPIAKSSLFKIVHDSKINSVVVDNQYYIKIADLLNFVDEHNVKPLKDFLAINKEILAQKNDICLSEQDILSALPTGSVSKTTILLWIKKMKPKILSNETNNCYEKEEILQIINKLLYLKEKEYQKFLNGFKIIEEIARDTKSSLIYQMPSPFSEKEYCVELATPKIIDQE